MNHINSEHAGRNVRDPPRFYGKRAKHQEKAKRRSHHDQSVTGKKANFPSIRSRRCPIKRSVQNRRKHTEQQIAYSVPIPLSLRFSVKMHISSQQIQQYKIRNSAAEVVIQKLRAEGPQEKQKHHKCTMLLSSHVLNQQIQIWCQKQQNQIIV